MNTEEMEEWNDEWQQVYWQVTSATSRQSWVQIGSYMYDQVYEQMRLQIGSLGYD